MKKIIVLLAAGLIVNISFASIVIPKENKVFADQLFIPVGKSGKTISLAQLAVISIKDIQTLTGNKLSFVEKLAIKASQSKLQKSINPDGSLNNRRLNKYLNRARSGETGFHVGGFVLGLFLGPIGVIIAYVINDDYKRNRVKWAWIGLALFLGILRIVISAAGL